MSTRLQNYSRHEDANDNFCQEFLTFTLGAKEYGVDIRKVQELRGYDSVTRVANAKRYVKGAINLRGEIVPIVDLRVKLNVGTPTYDQCTAVVVVNLGARAIGLVVDSVSEVIALNAGQITSAQDADLALEPDFVIGIGVVDQRKPILVDIEKVMCGADLGLIERLAA